MNYTNKVFSSSSFQLRLARTTSERSKGGGERVEHFITQLPLYQVTVAWLFPISKVNFFPEALTMGLSFPLVTHLAYLGLEVVGGSC